MAKVAMTLGKKFTSSGANEERIFIKDVRIGCTSGSQSTPGGGSDPIRLSIEHGIEVGRPSKAGARTPGVGSVGIGLLTDAGSGRSTAA